MGLEELKREIINNAKKQAEKILKEAEKEKELIYNSAEERLKEIKSRIDEETKNSLEQYKNTLMTEVNAYIKRKRLMIEKEIIEKVFRNVEDEIKNLKSKKREMHLKKILSIYDDYKKIYCAEQDLELIKKYNPKKVNILGGLILEDDLGETRINLSYDEILADIKKNNILDISKILFN